MTASLDAKNDRNRGSTWQNAANDVQAGHSKESLLGRDGIQGFRSAEYVSGRNSLQITSEGVPWNSMKSYIVAQNEDQRACHRIPFFVGLVAISILTAQFHVPHSVTRAVQASMADFLENKPRFGVKSADHIMGDKKLGDVQSLADFYSWFRGGFLPLAGSKYVEVSESEMLRTAHMKAQCRAELGRAKGHLGNLTFESIVNLKRQNAENFAEAEAQSMVSPRCFRLAHHARCLSIFDCVIHSRMTIEEFTQNESLCVELLKRGPAGEMKQHLGEIIPFTTILGGFRLRQSKVSESECNIPEGAEIWWGNNEADRPKCFPSEDFFTMPSITDFHGTSMDAFEHIEYFLLRHTHGQMMEKTRDLELGCPIVDEADTLRANDPRTFTANSRLPAYIIWDRIEKNKINSSLKEDQLLYQFDEDTADACKFVSTEHVKQGNPWAGINAGRIVLSFMTFNREVGVWSMTDVNFIRNRAGRMFTMVDTVSRHVNPYANAGFDFYALDVLFVLSNLLLLFACVRRFYRASQNALRDRLNVRKSRFRVVCSKVLEHTFRADTIAVVIAGWLTYMWVVEIYALLVFEKYMHAHAMVPLNTLDDAAIAEIFIASEVVLDGELERDFRFAVALYILVVIVMTLIAFHKQPRLSFVTRTMVKAWPHLFHFLIVFLVVLVCFAAIARAIFGGTSAEFADFSQSLITLYRCLYGEFPDDSAFTASGRIIFARIFFVTFTVITSLVMLNVVLAILLQAYDDIRRETSDSKPLYKYFRDAFTNMCNYRYNKYVSLDSIIENMEEYTNSVYAARGAIATEALRNQMLRPTDMMAICRQMQSKQAREIVLGAYEYACVTHLRAARTKAVEAERKGAVCPSIVDPLCGSLIPSVESNERPHGFQNSDIAVLWALLNERFEMLEDAKQESPRRKPRAQKTRHKSARNESAEDKSLFFGPTMQAEPDDDTLSENESPHGNASTSPKPRTTLRASPLAAGTVNHVDNIGQRSSRRRRQNGIPGNALIRRNVSPISKGSVQQYKRESNEATLKLGHRE
eukprot:GEMP01004009.1.p1 GENE.GEMP01004009.1~~GEMP01004009.1.p1  ORF type:complete len:1035 (-),score=180.59 GEMP01004009.1:1076-4180(-)